MLVPVVCFTCGKVLANKYAYYQRETKKLEAANQFDGIVTVEDLRKALDADGSKDALLKNFDRTLRHSVLDKLGLDRICCRRHMLSHVDLLQDI